MTYDGQYELYKKGAVLTYVVHNFYQKKYY